MISKTDGRNKRALLNDKYLCTIFYWNQENCKTDKLKINGQEDNLEFENIFDKKRQIQHQGTNEFNQRLHSNLDANNNANTSKNFHNNFQALQCANVGSSKLQKADK